MLVSSEGLLSELSVLVLGDSGVGKSAFINRFLNPSKKPLNANQTIMDTKTIQHIIYNKSSTGNPQKLAIEAQRLILHISEIGGGQVEELGNQAIANADAFFILYDVGNKSTFESCFNYYTKIIAHKFNKIAPINPPIMVIGSKIDLTSEVSHHNSVPGACQRQVSYEKGLEFAEILKLKFMESTCMAPTSISSCFTSLIDSVQKTLLPDRKPVETKQIKKPTGLRRVKSLFSTKTEPLDVEPIDTAQILDSEKTRFMNVSFFRPQHKRRVWLPETPIGAPRKGSLRELVDAAYNLRMENSLLGSKYRDVNIHLEPEVFSF
jgi:GTPase SAR1 family protein